MSGYGCRAARFQFEYAKNFKKHPEFRIPSGQGFLPQINIVDENKVANCFLIEFFRHHVFNTHRIIYKYCVN